MRWSGLSLESVGGSSGASSGCSWLSPTLKADQLYTSASMRGPASGG